MYRQQNNYYVVRRWVSKKTKVDWPDDKGIPELGSDKRSVTGQLVDPMYLVTVHDTHMGEGLGPIWKPVLERAHKFKNRRDAEIVGRMLRLEQVAIETIADSLKKDAEKFYFDVYPTAKDSKGVWE